MEPELAEIAIRGDPAYAGLPPHDDRHAISEMNPATRNREMQDGNSFEELKASVIRCEICKDRFRSTETAHSPRPVFWCSPRARLLVSGQAPGIRVHRSGKPFSDPSGERLRSWMGIADDEFYDRERVAILPMAFCFPGYSETGSDLPPPKICAGTWRARVLDSLGSIETTLLVGGYAQAWHLGARHATVTASVSNWREFAPEFIPLPHPSWRNNAWIARNPWFEMELLPFLRKRVRTILDG